VTKELKVGSEIQLSGINPTEVPDGRYEGEYDYSRWANTVAVEVQAGKIISIDILKDVVAPEITNCSEEIIDANNGFISSSQIKEAGIPYSSVRKMLNDGSLMKEERGLYRFANTYVDELYTLQYRYPKGIYSLETSLWLHGLSMTVPSEPVMSFPYGTNTKLIIEKGIKPIIIRSHYDEGIVKVKTPGGQIVRTYEIERTLAESLRSIYNVDIQIIAPAYKAYAAKHKVSFTKLLRYARMFKVDRKAQSYLEVLG
jgi:hypothetical protein